MGCCSKSWRPTSAPRRCRLVRNRACSSPPTSARCSSEAPSMAETVTKSVSLPTYDRMIWPTVLALRALGGSGTNREIDQQVIAQEGFTEQQQLVPHGDGGLSEASYRLMWSRTYLKAVGAIQNSSRGVWALTDYGRSLSQAEAEAIPQQVRAQH